MAVSALLVALAMQPGTAAPAAGAGGWDELFRSFATAHEAAETACAKSFRDAMQPPAGVVPQPFRVQLTLQAGKVAVLRTMTSSGDAEVDRAALDAAAAAVREAHCDGLPEISIEIPFR